MEPTKNMSKDYKYCDKCSQILSKSYPYNLCPACRESELFDQVKDYIRNNNVTEHQVALQFNIPVGKVKSWIREGRIQYKSDQYNPSADNIVVKNCYVCGKPILTGSYCRRCSMKITGVYAAKPDENKKKNKFHTKDYDA